VSRQSAKPAVRSLMVELTHVRAKKILPPMSIRV
jgi:hypothetical protein